MRELKRIKLKGHNDRGESIRYDLELRGHTIIVVGDSATGKTLMCHVIRQMITYGDTDKIVFDCTTASAVSPKVLSAYKDKLIVFDDADFFVKGALLDYILRDKDNYYILFRRDNFDVHLSPNYYAELVKGEDKVRRLKYRWEKAGWYD